MPDPEDPLGSTPEPTPQPPRAEQPTTPLPSTGTPPAAQPSPAAEAPRQAAAPPPAAGTEPAEPVTTASAAEAPAGPPPVHATAPRRRFRQVAAHRATQLVAVGLLGLVIGGGFVALLDRDGHRGGAHGRPGISRMDDRGGPGGPGPRGDRDRGPGWDDHGRFER